MEGIVVHQDGSPAAGVPVTVVGYDDAGVTGFLTMFFTLGFACLVGACGGDSTEGAGATTGADGGYRGSLPGSYVAGTETDTDWMVTAALPAAEGQAGVPAQSSSSRSTSPSRPPRRSPCGRRRRPSRSTGGRRR